jgi:hypothetical protein
MRGVWGAAGASVGATVGALLVVSWVPTGVAQPVSQSRPVRQAMCRNFIGTRFSMHAGPPVRHGILRGGGGSKPAAAAATAGVRVRRKGLIARSVAMREGSVGRPCARSASQRLL